MKTIKTLVLLFFANSVFAQLNGTYSVPGSFTSIAAAINSLNVGGVSGPVTINIAAGYTETAITGGYSLTASGTATNPIIFQKSGTGANPLLTAYSGGTATPTSALQDGIWRFIGCDYITIDGIDLLDPNTSNPSTMEFGYGLFKASASDGCKNNTIKNCSVTLNRINNANGSGQATPGSRGIEVVNALSGAHTTFLSISTVSGTSSNNKLYSNLIQNCNIGIALMGFTIASSGSTLNLDNGNDIGGSSALQGNIIINYGGGGAVGAAAAIQTAGQHNLNVSHNFINNNNGNGINHTTSLRGIYITNSSKSDVTIMNNTVTVGSGGTTTLLYSIDHSSGNYLANTIYISSNLITNCTYTGATSSSFIGILSSASFTLSVTGNTLLNISSSATGGTHRSISVNGIACFINNNILDIGNFTAITTSVNVTGVFYSTTNNTSSLTINSNTFQNLNFTGAIGQTGITNLIFNGTSINEENVSGNNFDNLSIKSNNSVYLFYDYNNTKHTTVNNNYITGGFSKTASGGLFAPYYCIHTNTSFTGTNIFSGNNFSNITLVGNTQFLGVYNVLSNSQVQSISNNTINNVTTGGGVIYGISQDHGLAGSSINSNYVSNLNGGSSVNGIVGTGSPNLYTITQNTVTWLSSTGPASVSGIFLGANGTVTVSKNKIGDISGSNINSFVYGIYQNTITGANINLTNNLIGDIRANAASFNNAVTGIYLAGGNSASLSFNTVYLNTSSNGSNFGSSALFASTTPSLLLRNNILINNSIANGTGKTISFYRSSPNLSTYLPASNYNIFYAGASPSASNCVFYDGTNTYSTLASYNGYVSPRDASSYTENSPFTSTLSGNINFLHINSSSVSLAESNGVSVTGITDDIDGQVRYGNNGYTGSGISVDIGADEFNGSFLDVLAPTITHTVLGTTCSVADRTLSADISDVSGIPTTGTLVPRIYYKKNSGSYISAPGVLASGSSTYGVWNFTISASALGGLSVNDNVSYFIIAQDAYSTSNVGSSPQASLASGNVNSVTVYPTTPYNYTITLLVGTYSVGSGGTYASLTQAANAYNTSCLNGPVNFVLIDSLYSSNETFPITFSNNPYGSATNSLYIFPASGVSSTIILNSGTVSAVIKMLSATNITIDGLNTGGSSINIISTNSTSANAGIWLAADNAQGCSNMGIKNVGIAGSSNTVTASYGIIAGTNSTIPTTAVGADNDFITLSGVSISQFYNGIVGIGTNSTATGGINNWVLSNNQVGPVVYNPLKNLTLYGMWFQNALNMSVTNNTISNITHSIGYVFGMNLDQGVTSSTINANVIRSVKNSTSAQYGGVGINIQTGSSNSNLLIQNNMISDISGGAGTTFTTGGYAGIRLGIALVTGGVKLYNNTVAMNHSNTVAGSHGANVTACMYFAPTANNIEIINNILYSNIQFTNGASKTFAVYSSAPASAFISVDYNDYVTPGSQGLLAFLGTTLNTLSQIQGVFGGNVSSQTLLPVFTSTNDLHLLLLNNFYFDNLGTPISGLTTDLDGQSRSLTTPDIGADEFTSPNCSTVSPLTILNPTTYSICGGQSVVFTRGSFLNLPGLQQNWQVASTAGGPYTTIASVTGSSYSTPTLSPGTYYYIIANTCSFSSQTAVSNEATVSVYAYPTVSASATSASICSGNTTALSASGASTYTWSPNFNLSGTNAGTVIASPTFSTTYTLTGSNPGGCLSTNSPVITISVAPSPGYVTATYTSNNSCAGTSASLQALATSLLYTVTPISFSPIATPTAPTGYTLCMGGTVTTVMNSGYLDDGDWYIIPFNFNFSFFATTYTGCAVSSNGFITLQTVGYPATNSGFGFSFPNSSSGRPSVGAVYGDLTFANTGTITAFTVGTAPFRKFVVNWNNGQYKLTSSTATGTITTQLILYESSNIVEVHTTRASGQNAAVEGIQNSNATVAYVVPGRNNATFNLTNDAYRWNPAVTYSWQPPSYLSTTSSSVTTASGMQSNMVYTVVATAVNGCYMTTSLAINSAVTPTLSVSGTAATVCAGASVSLTASGASTYSWNTGTTGSQAVVSPTSALVYSVTGVNGGSCSATSTIAIAVYSLPVIAVTGNSVFCPGNTTTLSASGASTYTWNTSSTSQTIVVTPTASTNYTVTGTNANSCTNSAVLTITVNPTPTISISGNTVVCIGNSATLVATGNSTGYVWSNSAITNSIIITPTIAGTYSVTGTSSAGCQGSVSLFVNTASLPTLSISGNTISCSAGANTLIASGATSYSWSNGATGSLVTVSPTTATVYSVTGANIGACSGTATFNVNTYSLPAVSISGATAFCPGGSATLSASGASSYTWNTLSNAQSIIVTPTTSTNYTVTGTDANSCTNTAVKTVTVYALPTITISGNTSICTGSQGTLTASGTSTGYVWSNSVTAASIIINPTTTVAYSVVGTSSAGCLNSASKTVTVNSLPSVSIAGNSVTCSGSPNTLSASGASTYSWSTGATGSAVVVSPTTSSVYTVTGSNPCSAQAIFSINVNPLPTVSILGNAYFCIGGTTTLSASGANSYSWNTSATSQSIVVSPTTSTSYTLIGIDTNSCSNITVKVVTINPLPLVSIVGNTAICIGSSGTLNASGTSTGYVWSNSVGTGSIVISPTTATSYSVSGTSSAGCQNTASVAVIVNPLPAVSISGTTVICAGANTTISALGAGAYLWSTGSTASSIVISPLTSTSYSVTGTNSNSCSNPATLFLSVNPLPNITISGSSVFCVGTSGTLLASGANSYTWSTASNLHSIVITPTSTTSYSVSGTDTNSCTNTALFTVTVNPSPLISITGNTAICTGSPGILIASGTSTAYAWSNSATGTSITITPTANTSYSVSGTSSAGCVSAASVAVSVNPLPSLSISGSTFMCSGTIQTLSANGAATYTWNNNSVSGSISISPQGTSAFSVNGTSSNGCVGSASLLVTVVPTPTLAVFSSSSALCIGNSVTLNASGATTYSWNTGAFSNIVSLTPSASAVYSVTGTNSLYCSALATVAVSVFSLPVLNITVSPTLICASNPITLTAQGANTYSWNNGPAAASQVITPTSVVNYSVSGTNTNGCSSSASVGVTPLTLPLIQLLPASATVCAGTPVSFSVSGGANYVWSNSSTASSTSFTPMVSTVYSISATHNLNACSNSSFIPVTALFVPGIGISGNNTICATQSATLTLNGIGTPTWNTGSNSASIIVTPTANSIYTVAATFTNGCVSQNSILVTVNPVPVITLSASSDSVCLGNSATLTAAGANSYSWNIGSVNSSIVVSPTVNTTFLVTGTGSAGCSASQSKSISVLPLPLLTYTLSNDTLCDGDELVVIGNGGLTYTLMPVNVSGDTMRVSPSLASSFTVITTGNNGCSAWKSFSVHVEPCLSVRSNSMEVPVKVIPNPFSASFFVQIPDAAQGYHATVYNSLGQIVWRGNMSMELNEVSLAGFSNGAYFVVLKNNIISFGLKVIKAD